jgi:SSS family solute:Na+ symporter
VTITTGALEGDVAAGRAAAIGQSIRKPHVIEPAAIYFEKVARRDPSDPASPKIGIGRFNAEIWVLGWTGIDFAGWTKAQLSAARFGFDALFPFLLLFLISLVTKPVPKKDLDRFFGKIHTPVQATPEADALAVEAAANDPERIARLKIRPGSSWEILKPTRMDVIGFGGSWLMVGIIILLLGLMVRIR